MFVYGTGGLSTNGSEAFSGSTKYDNGAYVSNNNDPSKPTTNNGFANSALRFKASGSDPIYGNFTTVQPPAIQLMPQIKY